MDMVGTTNRTVNASLQDGNKACVGPAGLRRASWRLHSHPCQPRARTRISDGELGRCLDWCFGHSALHLGAVEEAGRIPAGIVSRTALRNQRFAVAGDPAEVYLLLLLLSFHDGAGCCCRYRVVAFNSAPDPGPSRQRRVNRSQFCVLSVLLSQDGSPTSTLRLRVGMLALSPEHARGHQARVLPRSGGMPHTPKLQTPACYSALLPNEPRYREYCKTGGYR